jgi:hypothetical protein
VCVCVCVCVCVRVCVRACVRVFRNIRVQNCRFWMVCYFYRSILVAFHSTFNLKTVTKDGAERFSKVVTVQLAIQLLESGWRISFASHHVSLSRVVKNQKSNPKHAWFRQWRSQEGEMRRRWTKTIETASPALISQRKGFLMTHRK